MHNKNLHKFLPAIRALQLDKSFTKQDLLIDQLLFEQDGAIKMYYSPHNEYINTIAKIVIVGITPGWNQMKTAYTHFLKGLSACSPLHECLRMSK